MLLDTFDILHMYDMEFLILAGILAPILVVGGVNIVCAAIMNRHRK